MVFDAKTLTVGGRFLDRLTSEERKQYPMSSGLIDYFPDFLALIAHVSYRSNEKHNPGEPMHWSRGKSTDHPDCVIRHHSTRDAADQGVPLLHLAEEGWRVLAMGQEAMEKYYNLSLPPNARFSDDEETRTRVQFGSTFKFPDDSGNMLCAASEAPAERWIVQWVDGESTGQLSRIVATVGPFDTFDDAEKHARDSRNKYAVPATICTLSTPEEE